MKDKCLLLKDEGEKEECSCCSPFDCPYFEEFKQLALEKWPPPEEKDA